MRHLGQQRVLHRARPTLDRDQGGLVKLGSCVCGCSRHVEYSGKQTSQVGRIIPKNNEGIVPKSTSLGNERKKDVAGV